MGGFAQACPSVRRQRQDGAVTDETVQPAKMLIEGIAGEALTLPFPKGPATGYEWQWTLPDDVIRLPDLPDPPEVMRPGAPDGSLPQLLVEEPGDYEVYGEFGRPWEDAPERRVVITLEIR